MSKFHFIDLFAGIGGTRLAFEAVGGECVFSCEYDEHAQKTYFANFNEIPKGDITKIASSSIPEFDILLAGFPCQPFSAIGKREGFEHLTQGTLFYDIARILKDKNPKAFLLENVEGLLTHDRGNTFKIIRSTLEELGYYVFFEILDAADFGLPQKRKRIYIVGNKKIDVASNFKFIFPKPRQNNIYIKDYLEVNILGYSISKHLQNSYLFKLDDGKPELVDRTSKIQVKTLVASYHKIQRLTGTFVRDGETGIRLFTVNECKALQGFPENFIVPVSRTQMYRQFGNSVAIPVVKAIAKKIKEQIL
jgi:DNA (cytosine-5)-methyltransferase 1